MKDWKGNEIKVGDTVVVIKVSALFYQEAGTMRSLNDGNAVVTKQKHFTDGLWDTIEKYFVSDSYDPNFSRKGALQWPISDAENIPVSGFNILAIEGVSDNKDEYYRVKN